MKGNFVKKYWVGLVIICMVLTTVSLIPGKKAEAAAKTKNMVQLGVGEQFNIGVDSREVSINAYPDGYSGLDDLKSYKQLKKYNPKYITNKKAVAIVSSKGVVTAKDYGSAIITISYKKNKKVIKDTIKINVKKTTLDCMFIPDAMFILTDQPDFYLDGEEHYLDKDFTYLRNRNRKATYQYGSSNKSILDLAPTGKIKSIDVAAIKNLSVSQANKLLYIKETYKGTDRKLYLDAKNFGNWKKYNAKVPVFWVQPYADTSDEIIQLVKNIYYNADGSIDTRYSSNAGDAVRKVFLADGLWTRCGATLSDTALNDAEIESNRQMFDLNPDGYMTENAGHIGTSIDFNILTEDEEWTGYKAGQWDRSFITKGPGVTYCYIFYYNNTTKQYEYVGAPKKVSVTCTVNKYRLRGDWFEQFKKECCDEYYEDGELIQDWEFGGNYDGATWNWKAADMAIPEETIYVTTEKEWQQYDIVEE